MTTYDLIQSRVKESADKSVAPFLALMRERRSNAVDLNFHDMQRVELLKLGKVWCMDRYGRSVFNGEVLCEISAHRAAQLSWDPDGASDNMNFFGSQRDWNQTLLTRINEAKAIIYRLYAKLYSGIEYLVFCKRSAMRVVQELEFYHPYFHGLDLSDEKAILVNGIRHAGTLGGSLKVFQHGVEQAPDIVVVAVDADSRLRIPESSRAIYIERGSRIHSEDRELIDLLSAAYPQVINVQHINHQTRPT